MRPEKNGSRNAGESGKRRIGVAAVVPCVGNDGRRVDAPSLCPGVAEEPLLGDYRDQGHPERYHSGTLKRASVDNIDDAAEAVGEKPYGDNGQRSSYEKRGHCFVFSVAVLIGLVGFSARDAYHDDYYYVGDEIAERMDSVGDHGARAAYDSGGYFQSGEHGVHAKSHPRDVACGPDNLGVSVAGGRPVCHGSAGDGQPLIPPDLC